MILVMDVGNTQIYGGVFDEQKILLRFRKSSKSGATSDEVGVFLRGLLRENDIDFQKIRHVAICTVVPDALHSLINCSIKYFNIDPFILGPGVKTGLNIKYKNPLEVGADRIANAVAGVHLHPNQNLIIVDFGTANTFCAISKNKEYLGGVITPGLKISSEALSSKTAKLPIVEIKAMDRALSKTTVESIQAGLYFGNLFIIKEMVAKIKQECFPSEEIKVIGTGGFSRLYEKENVFNEINGDLVLIGLSLALKINT